MHHGSHGGMRRILIAGASLAGVSAAQALREAGFPGTITLLGAEPHPPYDRPPLSKEALSKEALSTEALSTEAQSTEAQSQGALAPEPAPRWLRPDAWYAEHGIDLRLSVTAAALDTGGHRVILADGTQIGYDGLVLATGARPAPLPAALAAPGVLTLRTVEDAAALRPALAAARRVLVIGAGFIGLEVAAAAQSAGAQVTLVEVAMAPLARALGDQVGEWMARRHRAAGADVRCGQPVQRILAGADGYQAVLGDGTILSADVVVAAMGVLPAVGWLRGSGLRVGDGVVCDEYCRTSVPGVVAAGDLARWYNPLFDEDMRIEHWTNAVEQGRAAALTLLGDPAVYAPVPYFWSDQYGMRIRFAGRAYAAAEVRIEDRGDGSMVALFQRDGLIRGVLCVDTLRELPVRRQQILNRQRWEEVVPADPVNSGGRS
jgi:NADPH-dependent 2,4-dienoyl-CoA reductase/sulfur reductase-like enzyme